MNVEVRGGVLHADCRGNLHKNIIKTSIEIAKCAGLEIINAYGNLRCGGIIRPEGPYLKTCRNIRVDGLGRTAGALWADCENSKGKLRPSRLTLPCRGEVYSNEDGRLVCRA